MTAISRRTRAAQRYQAKGQHPASRVKADGRGPRRPCGRRTSLFLVLFATSIALTLLGAVMVLSASAAVSLSDTDSAWSLFRRQILWAGVGATAMMITMRVDYRRWRYVAIPAMVGSILLLILVKVPGIGVTANGATRWIRVGSLTFQPSELVKFAIILFVADLLARPSRPMQNAAITIRPILVVTGSVVALLSIQPHLGVILVIGVIVVVMLFLAGAPLRNLTGICTVSAVFVAMMVLVTPWRRQRFLAFRNPWSDPSGVGYQPLQSLHAITVGGWSGVGLGASRAKWGFLPFAHTDFIFAIIAEELGLIGAAVVIVVFVIIAIAGFTAALRAPDRFGLLLGVGITTWIVAQALFNIGAVMSLLPVMGVTLPFLSFGGSSLAVTLGAMGVLLNIARQAR